MKIDKSKIQLRQVKKETTYTYYDDNLGELIITFTEKENDQGEQIGVIEIRIKRVDYCIPELIKEVSNIHFSDDK